MPSIVTVAIPTLNAGPDFARTLSAVRAQRVEGEVELLVCDSGSSDATVATARAQGARVLEIARAEFSHGGTRNLLMADARGDHVAFLTQDAIPADVGWLAALLSGFSAAPNVGLVFGPYRPPQGTRMSVAREIDAWFASFSDYGPRVDLLEPAQRDMPPRGFLGQLGFFTDANGCLARSAWERVPFRPVAYAEDHRLAQDMLRAGYAKVFVPEAAVIHAHDYSRWNWLRRSFDESRAVQEVYGWAPDTRTVIRDLRGGVMGDLRAARHGQGKADRRAGPAQLAEVLATTSHHSVRGLGVFLGPRSARWPRFLVRRLSLERRA